MSLALALASGASASPGAHHLVWSSPIDVSGPATSPFVFPHSPFVGGSNNGALAVWLEASSPHVDDVLASTFDGTAWSTPTGVSSLFFSKSIDVSGDQHGAVVVMQECGGPCFLFAQTFDGATWSAPAFLVTSLYLPGSVRQPSVTGTNAGAVAAWPQSDGTNITVRASTFDGAAWSSPVAISAPVAVSNVDSNVEVTGTNLGAVATWRRSNGTNQIVQAATYDGSTWSAPVDLSSPGHDATDPHVTGTPSGAISVWDRSNGTNQIVQAATYDGSTWSAPVDLTGPGHDATDAQITGSATGALAVFVLHDGGAGVIEASAFNGGAWTQPVAISSIGEDASAPRVSGDSTSATALWLRAIGATTVLRATSFDGATWANPVDLSDPNLRVREVAVADPNGAVAVWVGDTFGLLFGARLWSSVGTPGEPPTPGEPTRTTLVARFTG